MRARRRSVPDPRATWTRPWCPDVPTPQGIPWRGSVAVLSTPPLGWGIFSPLALLFFPANSVLNLDEGGGPMSTHDHFWRTHQYAKVKFLQIFSTLNVKTLILDYSIQVTCLKLYIYKAANLLKRPKESYAARCELKIGLFWRRSANKWSILGRAGDER